MHMLHIPLAAAVIVLCFVSSPGSAQEGTPPGPEGPHGGIGAVPPPHPPEQEIPDLSDQQKEQIRKLHIAFAQKTLPLRNELAEKEAHLRSLMTMREPDQGAVDKAAEEIGNLRKEIFKADIAGEMKINEVLTEEQRAIRDLRPGPPGPGMPPQGKTGPRVR